MIATDVGALTIEDRRTFAGVIPIGRRRVRVPYEELGDARITNAARWTCLLVTVAAVTTVVLTGLPLVVDIVLGGVAALFVLMTFIRGIEVTRIDGRTWTFPICRTHEFDASLAVTDAIQRKDEPTARSAAMPTAGA